MGYLNFNIYIYLYRERGWEKASKPGFSAWHSSWHSSLTYGFSFFFLISPSFQQTKTLALTQPSTQGSQSHGHSYPPSTPILPSPSLSPAASSVFVSLADRSLASEEKPFRMNLEEKRWETGGTQAKVTLQNLAGRWAGVCAGQGKLG